MKRGRVDSSRMEVSVRIYRPKGKLALECWFDDDTYQALIFWPDGKIRVLEQGKTEALIQQLKDLRDGMTKNHPDYSR